MTNPKPELPSREAMVSVVAEVIASMPYIDGYSYYESTADDIIDVLLARYSIGRK